MSDFQRSLQFQGRNLQRQWQEKPLLRMAIWSLCLLLVVHLVMLSMDWREERGEEYRRLAGEWLKLQDVSRQTAWPERAMQAEQVLNLQRERFWQAPNASQARADVQAWLTERVRLLRFGSPARHCRIRAAKNGQSGPACKQVQNFTSWSAWHSEPARPCWSTTFPWIPLP